MSRNSLYHLKTALASIAAVWSVTVHLACAKQEDRLPIQTAPPGVLATHLKSCATKVAGRGQTVIKAEVVVCRRNAEGEPQDAKMQPTYEVSFTNAASAKDSAKRQLFLRQLVAFRIEDASTQPNSPERSVTNRKALSLVRKTCQPIIDQIFKRSGLEARHRFKIYSEGDAFATPGPIQSGNASDESPSFLAAENDGARGVKAMKTAASPTGRTGTRDAEREIAMGSDMHLLLDLVYNAESGFVLKDDPFQVASGPISEPISEPMTKDLEAARLAFCGQIVLRIAENYGLAQGRDCESVKTQKADSPAGDLQTSDPVAKKAVGRETGLMKPGRVASDLTNVKLAIEEIDEVVFPVCGKMAKANK